jgi:hypothetical protein
VVSAPVEVPDFDAFRGVHDFNVRIVVCAVPVTVKVTGGQRQGKEGEKKAGKNPGFHGTVVYWFKIKRY